MGPYFVCVVHLVFGDKNNNPVAYYFHNQLSHIITGGQTVSDSSKLDESF